MKSKINLIVAFILLTIAPATSLSSTGSYCEDFVTRKTLVEIPLSLSNSNSSYWNCSGQANHPACSYDRFQNPGSLFSLGREKSGISMSYPVGPARTSRIYNNSVLSPQKEDGSSSFIVEVEKENIRGGMILTYELGANCELRSVQIEGVSRPTMIKLNSEACSALLSSEEIVPSEAVLRLFNRAEGKFRDIEHHKNPNWRHARLLCQRLGDDFSQDTNDTNTTSETDTGGVTTN